MASSFTSDQTREKVGRSIGRRYGAEKRFQGYGIAAIVIALLLLVTLFTTIIGNGYTAFWQTMINLEVTLFPQDIDPNGSADKAKAMIKKAEAKGISFEFEAHQLDPQSAKNSAAKADIATLSELALGKPLTADSPELVEFLKAQYLPVTAGNETIVKDSLAEWVGQEASAFYRSIQSADYLKAVKQAIRDLFPEVKARRDKRRLYELVSPGAAFEMRDLVINNPELIGQRVTIQVPMSDDIDQFEKGNIRAETPESERRVKDNQIEWYERLKDRDMIETTFNTTLFTSGDSREPELAGIWGAVVGSFFTLLVTLALSFPIGVAAAVYLEEFAPTNKITDLIEVNINNLAAVPSIVFGLLGLAMFLNFFGMPRSAPVVGGLVLTLMTLPTIIIASRAALKSVPPSIREAALGVGASKMQAIFHHVLPLAMPGMLTGTIIAWPRPWAKPPRC